MDCDSGLIKNQMLNRAEFLEFIKMVNKDCEARDEFIVTEPGTAEKIFEQADELSDKDGVSIKDFKAAVDAIAYKTG